ncbi:PKD domain-containing protein [Candidatus Bathyarchaeota archaeon]|nr:PKD domain-containing protein [Candidatus Bathyarchaeota archaeon]
MKLIVCVTVLLMILAAIGTAFLHTSSAANLVDLQITAGESEKYLREGVTLQGVVSQNGLPVTNSLVAIVVQNDRNNTVFCRTLSVGNPTETWPIQITGISITDAGFTPINVAKTGTLPPIFIQATVQNPQPVERDVLVIISTVDASSTTLASDKYYNRIPTGSSITFLSQVFIPKWSTSGVATVYCSVYSKDLINGGIPYVPERIGHFFISKYEQGIKQYNIPDPPTPPGQGEYSTTFRSSPETIPGDYSVYSIARVSTVQFSPMQTAEFSIADISYPPEASFTYSPIYPYKNMTVTFDASYSSAGGYNDTIVSYKWNWGDGLENTTISPTITKTFTGAPYSYLVTLNVTNSAGLSATASKEIKLKHPDPTAAFEWTPPRGIATRVVTFNASSCDPGWDENRGAYCTISEYKWNFGDNTGNITTTNPLLNHTFASAGNYTVDFWITSSSGLKSTASHTVEVINFTLVGDITGPTPNVPDGKVDVRDVSKAAKAYGTQPGDPRWDLYADITGPTYLIPDGKVDVRDVALIAKHFGESI